MPETILNFTPAIFLALASGVIGVFALMRRMSLAADAISHIALPGLGLALLFKINLLLGASAALFLGVILIANIERKSKLPSESIVGVIFSLSLALGALITPREDLVEALFGGLGELNFLSLVVIICLPLLLIFLTLKLKDQLILQMISADLAKVAGVNVQKLDFYFLLIFAAAIILGLKFLGALLVGSLIIIPAATAKNLAWNINSMLVISSLCAVSSTVLGFILSFYFNLALGPVIVLTASAIFLSSLVLSNC